MSAYPVVHHTASSRQPTWLRIETRRVINAFLEGIGRCHGWKTIHLISPWLSAFDIGAYLSFEQFLKRAVDDRCTMYIVTRPPEQPWHTAALERLRAAKCANVVLVPSLHTKLYCASTSSGNLALLGSANFTQLSLTNRELGILLYGRDEGREIVRVLVKEAADIYRTSAHRRLWCKATI